MRHDWDDTQTITKPYKITHKISPSADTPQVWVRYHTSEAEARKAVERIFAESPRLSKSVIVSIRPASPEDFR